MKKFLLTIAVLVALAGTASACDYGNVRQLLQADYGYSQNVQFASTCGYVQPVQNVQFVRQNYVQPVQFVRTYGYVQQVQKVVQPIVVQKVVKQQVVVQKVQKQGYLSRLRQVIRGY